MLSREFKRWLNTKWRLRYRAQDVKACCVSTFSTPEGVFYLNYLIDNVYAQYYEGSDPLMLATHNGRRSVIHEILETLDQSQSPNKYLQQQVEVESGLGNS